MEKKFGLLSCNSLNFYSWDYFLFEPTSGDETISLENKSSSSTFMIFLSFNLLSIFVLSWFLSGFSWKRLLIFVFKLSVSYCYFAVGESVFFFLKSNFYSWTNSMYLFCCFLIAACVSFCLKYFYLVSSSLDSIFFGSNNSGVSIYRHSFLFFIYSRSFLKVSFYSFSSFISFVRSFEFCFSSLISFTRCIICYSSCCISCSPKSSSLGSLSELSPDTRPSVSDL